MLSYNRGIIGFDPAESGGRTETCVPRSLIIRDGVLLTEDEGGARGEAASFPSGRQAPDHYLIVRRQPTGFEMPHTYFRCGEEVVPVFCARRAARRFIALRDLGEGWYARAFYAGELISLLFALHERVAWVSFSPLPEQLPIEDPLSYLTSRDDFIASLITR